MALANYNDLKTAIAAEFSRADTGFTTAVPDFITRGEGFLNRNLRHHQMRTTASVSLSTGASTASLPTGYLSDVDLYYTSDKKQLAKATDRDLVYWGQTERAQPVLYRVGATYEFERPADQSYTLTAIYFKGLDLASDATNWLMTNYPDAYLYASCFEAAVARRNGERMGVYKPMRDEIVLEVNKLNSRTQGQTLMRQDSSLAGRRQFNINSGAYY